MDWKPETIRALRQRAGWTQVQLARACASSDVAVYKWEAGERTPSEPLQKRLNAISHALDDRTDEGWMNNAGYDRDGDWVGFRFKRIGDRVLMQMGDAVEGLFVPVAEVISFVHVVEDMLATDRPVIQTRDVRILERESD